MTKIEFLQQLYNLLGVLPAEERDDIIADFEEHFSVGTSEGKSEEQICSELGDPKSCAAQYLNDEPKKADAVYGAEKNGNPRYETKASDVIGASPRPQNARGGGYYGTEKGNPQRNHMLWSILFFFGVFAAIGVYPSSIGMMASFFACLLRRSNGRNSDFAGGIRVYIFHRDYALCGRAFPIPFYDVVFKAVMAQGRFVRGRKI